MAVLGLGGLRAQVTLEGLVVIEGPIHLVAGHGDPGGGPEGVGDGTHILGLFLLGVDSTGGAPVAHSRGEVVDRGNKFIFFLG